MNDTPKHILSDMLHKALIDYKAFACSTPPDDSKAYIEHQKACKTALAHLEQLIKLERLLGSEKPDKTDAAHNLEQLLVKAQASVISENDQ